MSTEGNVEIARRMFQAHHDGDLDGFLAPLADDIHYEYMTEHPAIGGVRNNSSGARPSNGG